MIAIVNYGIEKNHPLTKILAELKIDFKITSTETEILQSDKIILPHTGNISSAVKQLHLLNLFTVLRVCKKPMLGISHGMHLMCTHTKEDDLSCLGIFSGTAEEMKEQTKNNGEQIEVLSLKESKLFKNMDVGEKFYFNNSHYLPVGEQTSAVTGKVPIFSAAIEKNNFFGVQFLPEKSGEAGAKIIQNFAHLSV